MIYIIRKILTGAVLFYRWILSPFFGGQCRFWPSCSEYALQTLDNHSPLQAIGLILRRVSRCHPFHPGGVDLVPTNEKKLPGTIR